MKKQLTAKMRQLFSQKSTIKDFWYDTKHSCEVRNTAKNEKFYRII